MYAVQSMYIRFLSELPWVVMKLLTLLLQVLTDKLKNGGRMVIPVGENLLIWLLLAFRALRYTEDMHVSAHGSTCQYDPER